MNVTDIITIKDIKNKIKKIKAISKVDPEMAHAEEDQLLVQVLEVIASGIEDPMEYAKAVLMTKELHFPRWCG